MKTADMINGSDKQDICVGSCSWYRCLAFSRLSPTPLDCSGDLLNVLADGVSLRGKLVYSSTYVEEDY